MKILILGDGVIGSVYGYELSNSGYNVTHFIRKERIEKVVSDGISIRCKDCRGKPQDKEYTYYPKAVSQICTTDDYDLFIVSGKANTLTETLNGFYGKIPVKTTILIFQTLWQDAKTLESILPDNKIIYGFPHVMGGGKDEKGIYCTIFGNKSAPSMIGEKDGSVSTVVNDVYGILLKANMNPLISNDILGWIYTHYAEAAGLLCGVMQADDFINFAENKQIVTQTVKAIREGLLVCEARGINVKKIKPQCYYFYPLFILVMFLQKNYSTDAAKLMVKGHVTHSLDEMKAMVKQIIESGKEYGTNTSTIDKMYDKVMKFTL